MHIIPNEGWCTDKATLERRDKELQKMKDKPTYKRYLSEIPKYLRKKGVHPRTPNKHINHTRRSWDKQVRKWKLAIYEWAGEKLISDEHDGTDCPSNSLGGDCADPSSTFPVEVPKMEVPSTANDKKGGGGEWTKFKLAVCARIERTARKDSIRRYGREEMLTLEKNAPSDFKLDSDFAEICRVNDV
ncbi:hypothetical protein niasHS_011975 [Heterodera schachtii]|uniref:Histone RNA hairpin-binding protein RNA-binding domain-containing protein n=2 Tax=Heterodera TaxID=34509 RepID=A0ABD2IQ72_HETSC